MDAKEFLIKFHDHLAPRLDAYEQAIYLYVVRHGRLLGKDEVVIGFKSARTRMACGVGENGRPMSENTAYVKMLSLQSKGCIEIIASERTGRRIRAKLPHEITGIIPAPPITPEVRLEEMDFFNIPENRTLILQREENRCFYCLRKINTESHVIEHVVSRPTGGNGYRNVVAACRQCNNRKGSTKADDFLRILYRDGLLTADEFAKGTSRLKGLLAGEIKPRLEG